MKNLRIAALVCAISFMHGAVAQNHISLKDRAVAAKDDLVKRVTAVRVLAKAFFGGEDVASQMERLNFYYKIEKLNLWTPNPKKWYTWISTGSMPAKHPDTRVHDAEYVEHYLVCKALMLGRPLTEQEKKVARTEAMEKLNDYRKVKHIA